MQSHVITCHHRHTGVQDVLAPRAELGDVPLLVLAMVLRLMAAAEAGPLALVAVSEAGRLADLLAPGGCADAVVSMNAPR